MRKKRGLAYVLNKREGIMKGNSLYIYDNQKEAANECFNALEDTNSVVLAAETQSGKTGSIFYLLEKIWDKDRTTRFLVFGPPDLSLKDQTNTDLMKSNKISQNLVGSRVWHHPDLARDTRNQKIIKSQIAALRSTDTPIVVVHDEAHIAIGGKQKLLKFYKDILGIKPEPKGLPGNINFVMISATPFSQEAANFREVFLRPGPKYRGVNCFLENGLIIDFGSPPRNKSNRAAYRTELQNHISSAYEKFGGKGYFVMRASSEYSKEYIESVINNLKKQGKAIEHEYFLSKKDNIKAFAAKLKVPPNKFYILIINQSYKQGKRINKKFICGWLENCTKTRNDADLIQSIGRNFGYDANPSYSIYCRKKTVEKAGNYYKHARLKDKGAMKGMSDSHTNISSEAVVVNDILRFESHEDAEAFLKENDCKASPTTCSGNNETDIAKTVLIKRGRQKRGEKKHNVIYLDKANHNYKESWNKLDKSLHGKYVIIWPSGEKRLENSIRKNKSMFKDYISDDNKNKMGTI
jgi:hypothetical protein